MSSTTPTPDALDLSGLTPEQLDERLAQIEAAQVAARAEAKARADAHQARYEAGVMTYRRSIVANVPPRLDAMETEARAHRAAFEEAARDGDLLAAWSAFHERMTTEFARITAKGEHSSARRHLDPNADPGIGEFGPTGTSFLDEFLSLAVEGAAVRGRERVVAEFGAEPQFEDYAAPAAK